MDYFSLQTRPSYSIKECYSNWVWRKKSIKYYGLYSWDTNDKNGFEKSTKTSSGDQYRFLFYGSGSRAGDPNSSNVIWKCANLLVVLENLKISCLILTDEMNNYYVYALFPSSLMMLSPKGSYCYCKVLGVLFKRVRNADKPLSEVISLFLTANVITLLQ